MKKKSRISARAVELALIFTLFCAPIARASVELDRQYALETIGFLRATDNVDGLFADYVQSAYEDYFSKQSRFVVENLSKQDTILTRSKLPYSKLIQDPQILAEIARTTHSQSILRTKVLKEGHQYRFLIEWLHAPSMVPMATTTMVLQEPTGGLTLGVNDVQTQIESALDTLIKKIPWLGNITGRDGQQVTVNIGANAGLHKGDTLVIGTLDVVKRHPLLNTIVAWHLTHTGTVELDSVDDSIAFGHVTEEEPDQHIQRYQKIMQIIPVSDESHFKVINDKNERAQNFETSTPRLGFLKASLWPGGYSRQYNSQTAGDSRDGGGAFIGAKLDGQLWFTRDVFSELGFGYGIWSYSQQNPSSPSTTTLSGGGNAFTFKIDAGYSYLWTGDFTGPKAFAKLGYRSTSYSLPSSQSEFIGPISFNTVFLGLGGDLPIRDQYGVDIDFDIGVINNVTQTDYTDGSTNSASSVSFSLGGYYKLNPRMSFRGALEVLAQSATFSNNASISQKIITFTPSFIYYF